MVMDLHNSVTSKLQRMRFTHIVMADLKSQYGNANWFTLHGGGTSAGTGLVEKACHFSDS